MKALKRFVVFLCILIGVPGCVAQVQDAPAHDAVCTAATYEAGANRDVCGDTYANPIVVECDDDGATLRKYVGDATCTPGNVQHSFCCVGAVAK